jgi:hypothetical protein
MPMLIVDRERFRDPTRVVVEALDEIQWRTIVEISWGPYTVPAGYVTDFLSIPRVASWLAPRYARYTPAGILHDYLLTEYVAKGRLSSVDADAIFRLALIELGTDPVRVELLWTGVRWGAASSKYRRAGWWSTFPKVAAMTLYALPHGVVMAVVALGIAYHNLSVLVVTRGRRSASFKT